MSLRGANNLFLLLVLLAFTGAKAEVQRKVNHCFSSALGIKLEDLRNVVFEECIHQQIQSEQDQNEVNDYLNDFVSRHRSLQQQRWRRYKRQVYQPPQVDEQLVSAFLNSPEAVKMVLTYLGKQKKFTTTTTTTTTPRPSTRPPRRRHRPPPPPLSFFFGGDKPLSQLINEHRKTIQKIKESKPAATTTTTTERIWTTKASSSKKASDMQFFGPKDFVPKAPHNLPLRPMRLKYSSTKEFPTKTYGRLVPMPR